MKIKTLKTNQIAVEESDGTITFFSYDTEIARIKRNDDFERVLEYVTDKADYSNTTKRYLYEFLKEYNIMLEVDGEKISAYWADKKDLKKLVDKAVVKNVDLA